MQSSKQFNLVRSLSEVNKIKLKFILFYFVFSAIVLFIYWQNSSLKYKSEFEIRLPNPVSEFNSTKEFINNLNAGLTQLIYSELFLENISQKPNLLIQKTLNAQLTRTVNARPVYFNYLDDERIHLILNLPFKIPVTTNGEELKTALLSIQSKISAEIEFNAKKGAATEAVDSEKKVHRLLFDYVSFVENTCGNTKIIDEISPKNNIALSILEYNTKKNLSEYFFTHALNDPLLKCLARQNRTSPEIENILYKQTDFAAKLLELAPILSTDQEDSSIFQKQKAILKSLNILTQALESERSYFVAKRLNVLGLKEIFGLIFSVFVFSLALFIFLSHLGIIKSENT